MRESLKSCTILEGSTQEQRDDMEKTIKACMSEHIPTKTSKPDKQQLWIIRDILTMINRRDRAFKAWKKTRSSKYEQKFKLHSQCQSKIRKVHPDYTEGIFNLRRWPR